VGEINSVLISLERVQNEVERKNVEHGEKREGRRNAKLMSCSGRQAGLARAQFSVHDESILDQQLVNPRRAKSHPKFTAN
jgi:hypothetical protein